MRIESRVARLAAILLLGVAPTFGQAPPPLPEIVEEGGEEEVRKGDEPSNPLEYPDGEGASSIPEPRVTGLRCLDPFHGFALSVPNPDWQFLVDPEAVESFNEDARIAINAPDLDLYSMVIVEELPHIAIEDYADLVRPALEDLELTSNEAISISQDLPGWRQTWEGSYDGIRMRFHYTLIAKEMYRIQIVSWCAKSVWSADVERQFDSIGSSFQNLGPAMTLQSTPWAPPAFVGPEDRYENSRHGFTLARPSPDWSFLTSREELNALNSNATVALHLDETAFSMVIVERLPDLTLAEYSGRVVPNLEGGTLVGEKETSIAGIEARRRKWRGKFDDVLFDFHYALLDLDGRKIQIVSWCATNLVDEDIRAQIRYIEESFAPLTIGDF